MSKDYIYTMSHPTPKWSDIDPYSSLEDIGSDNNDNDTSAKTTLEIATEGAEIAAEDAESINRYSLRTRSNKTDSRSVNVRTGKIMNYCEDSDSDTDYTPRTRPQ